MSLKTCLITKISHEPHQILKGNHKKEYLFSSSSTPKVSNDNKLHSQKDTNKTNVKRSPTASSGENNLKKILKSLNKSLVPWNL